MAEESLFREDDVDPQQQAQPGASGDGDKPLTALADQSWEAQRLAAARKEAEDEATAAAAAKAAAEATPTPAAAPADKSTAEAAVQPAAKPAASTPKPGDQPKPEGDKPTAMIPKPAFDERLNKERESTQRAREEAAYWKGRAEALAAQAPAAGQPGQPAQKSPDQIIAEARAEKAEKARLYDDGKISTPEWEQIRDALDDRIFAAQEAKIEAKMKTAEPAKRPDADDLYMDEKLSNLEKAHPFVYEIEQHQNGGAFFEILADLAAAQLKAEGIQMPEGPRGDYIFRERIAILADEWGQKWFGMTLDQARQKHGLAAPSTQQSTAQGQKPEAQPAAGAPAQKPAISPQATARKEKLALAAKHPADIHTVGMTNELDEVTESDIEKMTSAQIAALPKHVRRKFLPLND